MRLKLTLGTEERRTLREMGIYHPHARTRMRAQGMFRLAQGLTLQQVANEFEVHLNSVENWRQRWDEFGLVGLFEGRHTGRPPKLSEEERRQLGDLARDAGGTARTLQRQWQRAEHTPLSCNVSGNFTPPSNREVILPELRLHQSLEPTQCAMNRRDKPGWSGCKSKQTPDLASGHGAFVKD